jgi:TetR/AcrR family transcriptional repressor of nem operon
MVPKPRASSDTRERILDAARHLFWEKGYGATSLSELLGRAGANSGSFYHFFESKDAVLRDVLTEYVTQLEPHVVAPAWRASEDPVDRIFALLEGYRRRLVETECTYGCPIGRLALEIDPENTPAHTLIAKNFTAWRAAVEGCCRAAAIPNAEDVAALVLTVMEGGVMQARAYRSLEPFDASVRQLKAYVKSLAARPGPRPAGRALTRRVRK